MTRRDRFLQNFILAQRPGVVDFLRQHIVIPRSMSPARMSTATSPVSFDHQGFAQYILECADPARGINDIAVCSATQVFKTFGLLMMLAYRIVNVPSPKLIVFPTKDTAQKAVSRKKLQPLIHANPILAERKPANKDHFTDMEMDMRGGAIRLTGTGSATNLASTSEQDIFQDECCKFEHHISEDSPEAHPMDLADERAKSFGPDGWRYKSSSPNIITHPFWIRYEAGSQTHFLVTCPECRHLFPFEDFPDKTHDEKHIGYEKVDSSYRSLVWSPDAKDKSGNWIEQKMRETIRYICPACAYPIPETQRLQMLDHVEPFDLNPSAADRTKSFRLPSFYSPALTFGDVAWNRIKPSDLFDNHQNHQNSWLANCFQQITANVKTEDVRKLRDNSTDYRRGIVPRMPVALFAGADVGDYATHWVIGAVFDNDEIAAIDWGTVLTPEDLIPLGKLWKYPVANSDTVLSVSRGLIDAKDQTIRVYNMCQASNGFWWPASGSDARTGSWGFTPLKTHNLDRYTFNSFQFKKEFYVNLIQKQKAPRVYLPKDADESLIDGLSGQQLVTVKGKEEFKKIPNDHFGDCFLRLLLARIIYRAEHGTGAPDMPPEPETTGREYILKQA